VYEYCPGNDGASPGQFEKIFWVDYRIRVVEAGLRKLVAEDSDSKWGLIISVDVRAYIRRC
jgi:hypothetical protein